MIALLLVLASSPLDPLWSLVHEERYEAAIEGALHIATDANAAIELRQNALILGLTAACSGNAERCDEAARIVSDWMPLWRPDSRALPSLVQAFGRARLTRADRYNALSKGQLSQTQWCGPSTTANILLVETVRGVQAQHRVNKPCKELNKTEQGFLVAYDAQLRPIGALGSLSAPVTLRKQKQVNQRPLTVALTIAGITVAGVAAYLLLSDPGTGNLELTVENRP